MTNDQNQWPEIKVRKNGQKVLNFRYFNNMTMSKNMKSEEFTLAFVTRQNGGINRRFVIGNSNRLYGYWGGAKDQLHIDGWLSPAGTPPSNKEWDVYVITRNKDNKVWMYRNGVPIVKGVNWSIGFDGLFFNVGGCCGGETSDAELAEVALWKIGIGENNIKDVNAYLSNKWLASNTSTSNAPIKNISEKTSLMGVKFVRIAPSGENTKNNTAHHGVPYELSQIVIRDENNVNIAKGSKITSSSTASGVKDATRLINGDEKASEWPDVWANRTQPPFVEVELNKPSTITEVVIYSREGTKYYLNGSAAVVWFLDANKNVMLKRSIPEVNKSKRVLDKFGYDATPGNVKIIRIERKDGPNRTEGYIQLNQLAAFDLNGNNVARYQNVRANHAHRAPEHIVDGDLNFNRDGDKLYHSHGGRPDDWLEITLPKPTSLKEIKLYNRGDGAFDAIAPFKLVLLDANRVPLSSFNLNQEKLQVFNVTGKAAERK
jgi:hypothetical protein